jgi:drug/metabolite transporter (DMT)-like permease
MGLIAPLAALIGAGLPALVATVSGEVLSELRLAGILLALGAVVLISLPLGPGGPSDRAAERIDMRELPLVAVSGLGFAGFFLFLDRAVAEGGETWWPILAVRAVGLAAVVTLLLLLLVWRAKRPITRRARDLLGLERLRALPVRPLAIAPLFVLAGAGDLGGNLFFLLANERDALSVAVVLSSLYPIVTTVLAAIFLRERLRPLQLVGIGLAVLAVVLIRG